MKDVRDSNSGTEIQMAAIGPQDRSLTLNPEMSFFAHSWERHGAFASTPTPVYFDKFVFGERCRVEIPRSGDVLRGITVEIRLPPGIRTTGASQNKSFMRRARLVIDDSLVQDVEGVWLDVIDKILFDRRRDLMARPTNTVYIPLRFVQDLPLVAMWRSRVFVDLEATFPAWLRTARVRPEDVRVCLLCDYVDLDAAERAMLLHAEHQILYARPLDVDALSYDIALEGRFPRKNLRLDLSECNVPCVFLAVVAYDETDREYTYLDAIESIRFLINAEEQYEERPTEYLQLVQPYQHSPSACPADANIHVLSFGLKMSVLAESNRAAVGSSGAFNLAGVRSPTLSVTMAEPLRPDLRVKTFVCALNWLRVANGYAAPVFA